MNPSPGVLNFIQIRFFEKSVIMTPYWKFYENGSSVKSLGTTICTSTLSFVKIGPFWGELEIWHNVHLTYYATAAILNVVDSQYSNGHIYKVMVG